MSKNIRFFREESFWCTYEVDVPDDWKEGDDVFGEGCQIVDFKVSEENASMCGDIEDLEFLD